MSEIITMGEAIVEIMRANIDEPLDRPGTFKGPYPSGAPSIFIDTVARLGHSCALISGVGDDDFGNMMIDRLSGDGVDTSMVLKNDKISTGCAFVMYYSNGERKFIFHIGNTPAVQAPVPEKSKLEGCKYFHIMGCSMMADISFGKRIVETMSLAVEAGAEVSFDPNIRPELMKDPECNTLIDEVMDRCTIFMPGKSELLSITEKSTPEKAVKFLFGRYTNIKMIVLKNGKKGCIIYTREQTVVFGIYDVVPVDATGAGDSFDAAFLCSLIEGKTIIDAAKVATAAASLNTAAFGPMEGHISKANIEKMINENETNL